MMNVQHPPVISSPLFLLDYDGTLAPIQHHPMDAVPHKDVPGLLSSLSESHPLWIVTGRNLRDLKQLMPIQLDAIGLHGLQKGQIGGPVEVSLSDQHQRDLLSMRKLLPEIKETRVEDKEYTFAIHYRGAVDEDRVIEALKNWVENIPPSLSAIWGKKVLELKPKGISKGTAIQEILEAYPGCQPIYIGDDTTDETAFSIIHESDAQDPVTIKVGSGKTHARYRLDNVDAVVSYLKQYTAS